MKKYFSLLIHRLDAFFIALVLNVNVLRIFLGIGETNALLYMVYVLAMFFLFVLNRKRVRSLIPQKKTRHLLLFVLYLITFSGLSLVWVQYNGAFTTFLKFTITLTLAFLCLFMPSSKIMVLMYSFLLINVIYSIMFLVSPDSVNSLMGDNMNYLNATLTLGFSFSITLVQMLVSFFQKRWLGSLLWVGLSALFFAALLGFVARGVLLFPPLIMVLLLPFIGKNHMVKSLIAIGLIGVLVMLAVQYFLEFADSYGVQRMMRFFEESEDEDRFEIWRLCSKIMFDNLWFFFGGGICAFSTTVAYPHNIFLHILGEFGMIPLGIFVYIIIRVISNFIKLNKRVDGDDKRGLYFVVVGVLYYLLTFSKSFSLYDALPLFIMMALIYGYIVDSKELVYGKSKRCYTHSQQE